MYFLTFFSFSSFIIFHFPSQTWNGMSFAFLLTVSQKAHRIYLIFFLLSWRVVLHHELCNTYNSSKGCAKLCAKKQPHVILRSLPNWVNFMYFLLAKYS